jgi:hypothetical protein
MLKLLNLGKDYREKFIAVELLLLFDSNLFEYMFISIIIFFLTALSS